VLNSTEDARQKNMSTFEADEPAAKTEADCQKAGGMWGAKTNTCAEKKM
jgi:hypothetical protein